MRIRHVIHRVLSVALGGAALLGVHVACAADNWGTQADAFLRNCTSDDCSGGAVGGGDTTFAPTVVSYQGANAENDIGGSLGTASVSAAFESAAPGLATARHTATATGSALGVATAQGGALDLVAYAGAPTTITLTVDLDGSHSGPASGQDNGIDGLLGIVRVFLNDDDIDSLAGEMSPGLECLGKCYAASETLTLEIADGAPPASASIQIDLADGDRFYIHSLLSATGAGGGQALTMEGLSYRFSSTAGLTSLAGGASAVDSDGDGVGDDTDNCTNVVNADQLDADGDGFGNACDADLNNDNIVNVTDLGLLRQVFFTDDPVADFNGDGIVNVIDLGVMRGGFFLPPGPGADSPRP